MSSQMSTSSFLQQSFQSPPFAQSQQATVVVELLEEKYEAILKKMKKVKKVCRIKNYSVSNQSLKRLKPGIWLNDELVNAYVYLVNQRCASNFSSQVSQAGGASAAEHTGPPLCLCMNTFFMTKLCEEIEKNKYSFKMLNRWITRMLKTFNGLLQTRSVASLAELDYLFIPINQNQSHWLLMVIDVKHEMTVYFVNSMRTSTQKAKQYTTSIQHFLRDYLNAPELTLPFVILSSVPQQTNGSDCGVCTCLNMAEIAQNPAPILAQTCQFSYKFDSDEVLSGLVRKLLCVQIVDGHLVDDQYPLTTLVASSQEAY